MDNYYYTYDEAGNQITKYETINGVDKGETIYTYDEMNRLKTVTEPDTKLTEYSYDKAGNREKEIVTMDSTITEKIYGYNEQNRLSSVTSYVYGTLTETILYTYDFNGNQLSTSVDGVVQVTNTYNLLNELVKTETSETTVENVYNGEGLRVEKKVGTEVTTYLYEYQQVVMEFDSSGNMKSKNVVGINLISRTIDGQKLYYMYNGNADVTALIDSVGVVQAYYYYDAFGVPVEGMTDLGGIDNPYRYKGYQYDEETGLYYLNARMYDPVTARFMQEDTYRGTAGDPLSLNYYTYTMNNPLVYWDPSGNVSVFLADQSIVANRLIEGLDLEIKNGTAIVNLRNLVEGIGGTVKWTQGFMDMHANVKTTYKDKTIMHYILPYSSISDNKDLLPLKGNYQHHMGYGYEIGGRVRVGLRAVAYELGFNVTWDGENESILLVDSRVGKYFETDLISPKIPYKAWESVEPSIENKIGYRGADAYDKVIDQFNITTEDRYKPKTRIKFKNLITGIEYWKDVLYSNKSMYYKGLIIGNSEVVGTMINKITYCNIYARDVSIAMNAESEKNAELPSAAKPDGTPVYGNPYPYQELDANRMTVWLRNYGGKYGWKNVSPKEAQTRANRGYFTVGAIEKPNAIGHIIVVRPMPRDKNGNIPKYNETKGVYFTQSGSNQIAGKYFLEYFGSYNGYEFYTHD